MYARVTTITGGSTDQIEQGVANFEDSVVPGVREMDGRGAILLLDRKTGQGMAITLWEDEEGMRRSEERANELRRDAAQQMGAADKPQVDRYEVAVFDYS